jgi:hypothetical protein
MINFNYTNKIYKVIKKREFYFLWPSWSLFWLFYLCWLNYLFYLFFLFSLLLLSLFFIYFIIKTIDEWKLFQSFIRGLVEHYVVDLYLPPARIIYSSVKTIFIGSFRNEFYPRITHLNYRGNKSNVISELKKCAVFIS